MAEKAMSYPLIEALFEVRYTTETNQPLGADAEEKLAQVLAERYPERQRIVEPHIGVQVQQQGNQLETRLLPPGQRVVFRARPPNRLVQLSAQALTVNMLRPYTGHQSFLRLAEAEWTRAREALGLRLGPQLVLRFVNRIERPPHRAALAKWLCAGPFVPAGVVQAKAGFVSKVQLQSEDETMGTSVTLGTLAAGEEFDGSLPVLLDIEVSCATSTVLPTRSFSQQLEAMYRAAQEAFFSSTSPEAHALWGHQG